jgi:hypothetical protein
MTNPIPHTGLFASPTLEQILEQIETLPKSQRATAHLVACMTMNACHKLVAEQIESQK